MEYSATIGLDTEDKMNRVRIAPITQNCGLMTDKFYAVKSPDGVLMLTDGWAYEKENGETVLEGVVFKTEKKLRKAIEYLNKGHPYSSLKGRRLSIVVRGPNRCDTHILVH
jgi:hypothetical protein